MIIPLFFFFFFFFNDTATTEIYTLSLHDALPIGRDTSSQRSGHFLTIAQPARCGGWRHCDEFVLLARRWRGGCCLGSERLRRRLFTHRSLRRRSRRWRRIVVSIRQQVRQSRLLLGRL